MCVCVCLCVHTDVFVCERELSAWAAISVMSNLKPWSILKCLNSAVLKTNGQVES